MQKTNVSSTSRLTTQLRGEVTGGDRGGSKCHIIPVFVKSKCTVAAGGGRGDRKSSFLTSYRLVGPDAAHEGPEEHEEEAWDGVRDEEEEED